MKQRIKQHEPAFRPFWAVSDFSNSGIAHLVEQTGNQLYRPHKSACGKRFTYYELNAAPTLNYQRCKRCMAAMSKEESAQ